MNVKFTLTCPPADSLSFPTTGTWKSAKEGLRMQGRSFIDEQVTSQILILSLCSITLTVEH